VVNNSISKPSLTWPTPWPSGSFRAAPTALLFIVVVLPIVLFGIYQAATSAQMHIDPAALSNPTVIIFSLLFTLGGEGVLAILVLALLPWASRMSLRELGYRRLRPQDVLIAFLGSIVMAIVANGGASLIQWLSHSKQDQQAVAMLRNLHDPHLLIAFGVFACILAPMMEETIFRVFLFNASRRWLGTIGGALVSGLCFGLAHGDPFAALPLALGGMILAFVYYRTGNAFASMITHGLFNSYTMLALVFAPQLAK
jgi:uncharacterized protein